jgi:phosphohistidine phosphatase SixA
MKLPHGKNVFATLFLVSGFIGLSSAAHAQKQLSDAELISSLKKGGHVIYIRHATTDVSKTDQNREDLSDWSKQRNLSDKGRKESVAIGLAVRAMAIPVADVIASPYCRCIETGKLAFGKAQVSKELAFSVGEDKKDAEQLAKSLKIMLGTKPAGQTNTVLISHSGNLQDAANLFPKPEGVTMIFKPQGNDAFELVQRVEAQEWVRLAERAGTPIDAGKLNAKMPERAQLCRQDDAKPK